MECKEIEGVHKMVFKRVRHWTFGRNLPWKLCWVATPIDLPQDLELLALGYLKNKQTNKKIITPIYNLPSVIVQKLLIRAPP